MFNYSLMKRSTTLHKTKVLWSKMSNMIKRTSIVQCFLFLLLPNFHQILTYTKEFSQESWSKFARFLNKYFSKLLKSYENF